uniref:Uncharacterized protein n=1 Tax=Romanomermis culicivorax TaxID=13658 RepID=A0A915JPW9_ROMCU
MRELNLGWGMLKHFFNDCGDKFDAKSVSLKQSSIATEKRTNLRDKWQEMNNNDVPKSLKPTAKAPLVLNLVAVRVLRIQRSFLNADGVDVGSVGEVFGQQPVS